MKALLGKEWLESKRTLKIIWLPIVFIILGLTQPLLVKYMPEILKAVGGIENPDALIQLMGQQTPESILGQTLASQYDQMGIIIFAIAAMGAISADRSSEMLAFIMTRPVRMASYIGSKWISEFVAAFSVLTAGYIFSAYYTFLLFGKFNIWHASLAFGIYFVWFAFLIGVVILCSASFKSGAATAGITVLLGLILTSITAVDAKWQMFNPAYLSKNAVYFLSEGKGLDYFGVCFGFTILLIIGLFFATYFVMKKKPLQAENH